MQKMGVDTLQVPDWKKINMLQDLNIGDPQAVFNIPEVKEYYNIIHTSRKAHNNELLAKHRQTVSDLSKQKKL